MTRALNLLSESICDSATCCGQKLRKLHDGGGLLLWIYEDDRKFWRIRYWLSGKEKTLSPGAYPGVSIGEARLLRDQTRKQLQSGLDPSEQRKSARREVKKSTRYHNQFQLALSDDGGLTIETPSRTVKLTRPQTDALKAFLLAVDQDGLLPRNYHGCEN